MIVNVHEAKTRLSQLLLAVEAGEEVVIARDGDPIARLVAIPRAGEDRQPGSARGMFVVPADFDDPLPDTLLDAFR